MIPVFLDPAQTKIALVGRGPLLARRLQWLRQAGAEPEVWSDEPLDEGAALTPRLPPSDEIVAYHAIWIAGLSEAEAAPLAQAARDAGRLVNVEDVVALCDFHTPAVVRRGRLTLAVGTGGASPAVARAARERLEAAFPEIWAGALDEIAVSRAALRAGKADFDTLVADARARLAQHGLI